LPRAFVALTALAGFLVLPSLVIHLATTNAITGRSVTEVDWLWPLTLTLFALQALYAAVRRLVNPFLGFFISAFDVLIAVDAVLRSMPRRARSLPAPALLFLAATTGTFSFLMSSPDVISSPLFVLVPMIAPAFPATASRHGDLPARARASSPAGWVIIFITQLTPAVEAVSSYRIHSSHLSYPSSSFQSFSYPHNSISLTITSYSTSNSLISSLSYTIHLIH
jgi:hypothetical protein